ncbi:MAG: UDP-N-acetylmuramoyl-L-alanine--D-glutamate ligase [Ignavibacteria bacterium]|nr:UDP-N-acetylmuramoyl-L-alanine--D-glutamate ligase [Ignavibacteria bacterium]
MKALVAGAGKSGISAAKLATTLYDEVVVVDDRTADALGSQAEVLREIGVELRSDTYNIPNDVDIIIVSPGVPPSNRIRKHAVENGIEIIGELEFGWRQLKNPFIAITGTNGKTTTTALTTYILQQAGKKAVSAGNIGTTVTSLVGNLDNDVIVVAEVSSYQLDTTVNFAPHVAVILNITPDHLSYHETYEHYVHTKWKIFANQTANDVVILNADDSNVASGALAARSNVAFISVQKEVNGAFIRGDELVIRAMQHKEDFYMPIKKLGLPGVHNMYNSMASTLAARAFEVGNASIRDSLTSFSGVEHRLETVRVLRTVKYVNDSKATNINAAWYALSSFDRPLVWIAGGRGDNNDYSVLDDLVATNVHAIVCIGEDTEPIFNHWCTQKRCVKALTMADAVRMASELADPEDVVLFSPACKSFDMYTDFEERGRDFKTLVNELK